MYDDIIHLAMDQQLLTEIRERDVNYKKLPLWRELNKAEDLSELESKLQEEKALTFEKIFHEPVGYHLMKTFLSKEHSVDKAVFVSDVEIYKTLQDPRARAQVAQKIFEHFCAPESNNRKKGVSIFEKPELKDDDQTEITTTNKQTTDDSSVQQQRSEEYRLSLITENTNAIGVYGRPIKKLKVESKKRNVLMCVLIGYSLNLVLIFGFLFV